MAATILACTALHAQQPVSSDDDPTAVESLSAYGNAAERSARFAFSFLRPSYRGYDYRWRKVTLNGVSTNDPQTGLVPWAALGEALSSADNTIYGESGWWGAVGAEQYTLDPLCRERAGRAVAAISNRTYSYRIKGSYNLVAEKWAVGIEISRRFGRSMTTQGILTDAAGITLTAAKVLDRRNTLRLTAIFSPTERSYGSPTTVEAAELADDPLYNPSWGMWNGRERSINVRRTIEPIVMLNHTYRNEEIQVENAIYFSGGRTERTALGWASAPNPMADYWASMPSAQKSEHEREELRRLWQSNQSIRQINFEKMEGVNRLSSDARYVMEDRVRDVMRLTAQSTVSGRKWSGGMEFTYVGSDNYKRMNDLLGGTYWRDVDSFLEQDDDLRELTQNDIRNPNRKIGRGDRFGYSYTLSTFRSSIWAEWLHRAEDWQIVAKGVLGGRIDQRTGHYEKQNFSSGRSFGASEPLYSWEHLLSLSAAYSPSGRFSATATLTWQTISPTSEEMFLSPRYRNAASPVKNPFTLLSGEISARYATPLFRLDARAYYTQAIGRSSLDDLYDDLRHAYVHYAMSGMSTSHIGFELFSEATIVDNFYGSIAIIAQDSRYISNPTAEEIKESTGEVIASGVEVMYRDLHIGTPASLMGSLGLSYRPYGWIVELRLNGFTDGYATLAPMRRTYDALRNAASPEAMSEMQHQQRLPSGLTLDLFAGRTWMLNRGGRSVGLYAGVNNILNNVNIATVGYESGRLRNLGTSYNPALVIHPTKYYRALGFNFFVNFSYRF